MAMKENSKKVLNYLKEINGAQVTAADVAEALGLEEAPFVKNGKPNIRCTKNGSAKIVIRAIAGGDVLGTEGVMGGTEFTKEISVLSRETGMAKNGGWL